MSSDTNNGQAGKLKAPAELSREERTPKHLKFSDPDLTVVVGEGENAVEFYHYKHLLAAFCPFFDNMLSSGMKEANENKIVFPDKDPNAWQIVCKILDPAEVADGKNVDDIISLYIEPSTKENFEEECEKVHALVSWLDFLGLDKLTKRLDKVAAKQFLASFCKGGTYPDYKKGWCAIKQLPCPLVKKVFIAVAKHEFDQVIYEVSSGNDMLWATSRSNFANYLLDDMCGDEFYQLLLSKVRFPGRMDGEERKTVVCNHFFWSLVELASKHVTTMPPSFDATFEDMIGPEGSED